MQYLRKNGREEALHTGPGTAVLESTVEQPGSSMIGLSFRKSVAKELAALWAGVRLKDKGRAYLTKPAFRQLALVYHGLYSIPGLSFAAKMRARRQEG
jgi:hypothetical protein